MGDHLWTGKLPRRGTRHPSLLSLTLPSEAGWNEYWGSQHVYRVTPARVRGLAVFADCLAEWTG